MRFPVRKRAADRTTADAISAELHTELHGPPWMYEWQLRPTLRTPVIGPNLPAVHRTREEMIETVVREALAAGGPEATALDLGCNEGGFSHRLLDWGARRVVGVDSRARNLRRAALLREHFEIPSDRLSFLQADVLELQPESCGRFDVVLMLGLIYHLERPLEPSGSPTG